MARRCLIFRPDEAVWECTSDCECGCALFGKTGYRSRLVTESFKNRIDMMEGWMSRIEEFSKRDFTVATDRLVALTSLAKFFSTTLETDKYFAGSWGGFLGFHLA